MPYISNQQKEELKSIAPRNAGELNYIFTEFINVYLLDKGLCYQTCNDIVGALDNAKHEFRRRVQDVYEDHKCETNGDVYLQQFI